MSGAAPGNHGAWPDAPRRHSDARAAGRSRCARPQYRDHGGERRRARLRRSPAREVAQMRRDRPAPRQGRRHRRLLRHDRRGRGDGAWRTSPVFSSPRRSPRSTRSTGFGSCCCAAPTSASLPTIHASSPRWPPWRRRADRPCRSSSSSMSASAAPDASKSPMPSPWPGPSTPRRPCASPACRPIGAICSRSCRSRNASPASRSRPSVSASRRGARRCRPAARDRHRRRHR